MKPQTTKNAKYRWIWYRILDPMNRLTSDIKSRRDSSDIKVPPRYNHLLWSLTIAHREKHPNMKQVERKAVGMMLGLTNMLTSMSGPKPKPAQNARPRRYQRRVERFLPLSGVAYRAMANPMEAKAERIPPCIISVNI